jgi:hypothetical protein
MSGLDQVGAGIAWVTEDARGWPEDYDATVTGGFALVARRGGLAEDVADGSGLRKDGPSMRIVMQ